MAGAKINAKLCYSSGNYLKKCKMDTCSVWLMFHENAISLKELSSYFGQFGVINNTTWKETSYGSVSHKCASITFTEESVVDRILDIKDHVVGTISVAARCCLGPKK